jgi:hypothetical protein
MASRGWEPPDVGDLLDPVALEQRHEVGQLVGRMTDRPDPSTLTCLPALRTLSAQSVASFRFDTSRLTPCVVAGVWLVGSLAACGGDDTADDPDSARPSSEDHVVDTARRDAGSAGVLVFEAVEVPAAFPAEFPIASESTVVQASAREGTTGTWSTITIVARGEPAAVFDWYRDALEGTGWIVQPGASEPPAHVLHAGRVDSYLDLATEPHPLDPASGWVRTHAEIWMTYP